MSDSSNKTEFHELTKGLTPQQKLFCENFVSEDFFGNGVQSYIDAYGIDITEKGAYESAKQCAYINLTKVDINKYITALIDRAGLNDHNVDKQLLLVINQNAEFSSKVAAIKEYNKLKQRIVEKSELVVKKKDLSNFTDDELRAAKEIADKIGD